MNPVFQGLSQAVLTLEESTIINVTFSPEIESPQLVETSFIFAEHPCLEACFECRT